MTSKLSSGYAGDIDDLMARGTTWNQLEWQAKAAAERRGTNPNMASPGKLKAHARYRARHYGWPVEMDDKGVRLRIPFEKA